MQLIIHTILGLGIVICLDSIAMKERYVELLKQYKKKYKKLKRWLDRHMLKYNRVYLSVLLVGIAVSFGLMFVAAAKPGDLLFFPKLITERVVRPVDVKDPFVAVDNQLAIIEDRHYSYNLLLQSRSCVQFALAEQELFNQISSSFELVESLNNTGAEAKLLAGVASILEYEYSEFCPLRVEMGPFKQVFTFLSLQLSTGLESEISRKIDAEMLDLNRQITNLSTEVIHGDQDLLNGVTSLILFARNQENGLEDQDLFRTYINVSSANTILTGLINERYQVSDWEKIGNALCQLQGSERCNLPELESRWNSVNAYRLAYDFTRVITASESVFDNLAEEYLVSNDD